MELDGSGQIPADRSNYGAFSALEDLSRERTRGILEKAQTDPASKIGDGKIAALRIH